MIAARQLRQACRHLAHRLRPLHPLEAEVCLLNTCNLKCIYCRCPAVELPQLSTSEWRAVIRRLASLGTLRLKFHGGEPTLRDDFVDLCAESRACGLITAAVTNGSLIPRRPALLQELDELVLSLDSPQQQSNDRLRGAGSHRLALQTLDIALGRSGLRVYINMVLTRHNLADLEEMLLFCEGRGIGFNAQPVVFGRGPYQELAPNGIALTGEEIREVHRRLASWKRQGRGLLFSVAAYEKAIAWPDLDQLTLPCEGISPCPAGRYYLRIEANGDVVPCCQYEASFKPMNIRRDGLDQALLHVRTHHCGDCWLAYYTERMEVFALKPAALWNTVRRG